MGGWGREWVKEPRSTHGGLLLSCEKECSPASCNNVGGPRGSIPLTLSEVRQKYEYCTTSLVQFFKKTKTNEHSKPICRNTEPQKHRNPPEGCQSGETRGDRGKGDRWLPAGPPQPRHVDGESLCAPETRIMLPGSSVPF